MANTKTKKLVVSGFWDDSRALETELLAEMKRKKRIVVTVPLSETHEARILAAVTSVRRVKHRK